jgi:hypothetical protein
VDSAEYHHHFANGSFQVKRLVLLLSIPLLITSVGAALRSYQTNFPATEDPISENNNWINGAVTGLDWGNVQTTRGLAFGTVVSGGPPYNDSTAALSGTWATNQSACGTVFIDPTLARNSAPLEIEIRLRVTIAPHNITGYEFNYGLGTSATNGFLYAGAVRWNGPLNNFTGLGGASGVPPALQTGDVFCASAIGSTLKAWVVRAGAVIVSWTETDSTYSGGAPGIGFYNQGGSPSDNSNFGFTSYQASEINSSAPAPPTNLRVTGVQ